MKFIIEKPFSNERNIENFALVSGGNTKNVDNSKDIKKNGEFKTNIDRSTVIKASQKIVNNVFNEVKQKNSAEAFNAIASSNSIILAGIECDVLNLTDINQSATAKADTAVVFIQKTKNKISNDLQTSIKKQISSNTPNDTADLMKIQNSAMKDFMDSTPGLDQKKSVKPVGDLLSAFASIAGKDTFDSVEPFKLVSAGNTENIDNSYKLEATLKSAFNLDESFKLEDKDEISNTVKNSVSQDNFAKCSQSASSNNNITLTDIKCNVANISRIKQDAFAKSVLTCTFNQTLISKVATSIVNRIDKRISRMIGAAKSDEDKERIKKFSDAVKERLVNASDLDGAVFKPTKQNESTTNNNSKSSNNDKEDDDDKEAQQNAKDTIKRAMARREDDIKKENDRNNEASKTNDNSKKPDSNTKNVQEEKKQVSEEKKQVSEEKKQVTKEKEEEKSDYVVFLGIKMTKLQKNILIGILVILVILLLILLFMVIKNSFFKKSNNSKTTLLNTTEEAQILEDSSEISDSSTSEM